MGTTGEENRIAQEEAMLRQIAMQAAQQRQANAARQDATRSRDTAANAQIRAAEIGAKAHLDAAEITARREAANNAALMERQLALAAAGKGMSEAERLARDDKTGTFDYRLDRAMGDMLGGGPAAAPQMPLQTAAAPAPAPRASSVPYDTTGFTGDVGRTRKSVDLIRAGMGDFFDEFDPYQQQGAAIRDHNGVLRTIHTPSESSSKTRNRDDIDALRKSMLPPPPSPGVTGDGATGTSGVPVASGQSPQQKLLERALEAKLGVDFDTQIGREQKVSDITDARSAAKRLRLGDYTGDNERAALEEQAAAGGMPVPKVVPRGKTLAIDEVKALDDFTNAEDEFKSIVSGVRGGQSAFGAEDRGAKQAADVARQIRAKAADIAKRTGGNQSLIAKELTAQALANQKGVNPGFLNKWGNMLAETYTLGEAETDREAFMRLLRKEMGLPE